MMGMGCPGTAAIKRDALREQLRVQFRTRLGLVRARQHPQTGEQMGMWTELGMNVMVVGVVDELQLSSL